MEHRGMLERKGIGHHRMAREALEKRDCTSLYTAPAQAQLIQAFSPFTLTWDPTCLATPLPQTSQDAIDIYLYVQSLPVHMWSQAPFPSGKLDTTFDPRWWNATENQSSSVAGQLVFAASGQPVALTPFETGPTFQVDFNGVMPAAATSSAIGAVYTGPSVETVPNQGEHSSGGGGLSGGKLAVAIIIPILALFGVIAGYIFWSRRKSKDDRKRWSAYVDDRMSVISTNWQSNPNGGPRASLAAQSRMSNGAMSQRSRPLPGASGLRNSNYVSVEQRPASSIYSSAFPPPSPARSRHQREMTQTSIGGASFGAAKGDRRSRISFAASVNEGSPRKGPNALPASPLRSSTALPPMPRDALARTSYYANTTRDSTLDPNALSPARGRVGHQPQLSTVSSLRNEVFSPALAVITGEQTIQHDDGEADAQPINPDDNEVEIGTARDWDNEPMMDSHMPRAERNSAIAPDAQMRAYAAARGPTSPPLSSPATSKASKGSRVDVGAWASRVKSGMGRSASRMASNRGEDTPQTLEDQGYINFKVKK